MINILNNLTFLLSDRTDLKFLFFYKSKDSLFFYFLKVILKTILCKDPILLYNFFIYCDKCFSCNMFFNKKHPDYYFLDCSISSNLGNFQSFINCKPIYSSKRVIIFYNFNYMDIDFIYFLNKEKKKNVFFIFIMCNYSFKNYDNYLYFMPNNYISYNEYVLLNQKSYFYDLFLYFQIDIFLYKFYLKNYLFFKKIYLIITYFDVFILTKFFIKNTIFFIDFFFIKFIKKFFFI